MAGDANASRPVRRPRTIVSYGGAGNAKTKISYGGHALGASNGSKKAKSYEELMGSVNKATHTEESIQRDEQDNAQVNKIWAKAIFILLLPIIGGCVAVAMGASFWIGLIAGCVVSGVFGNPFIQK